MGVEIIIVGISSITGFLMLLKPAMFPSITSWPFMDITKGKSSLRKQINKALLKLMKAEKWPELLNRYT